MKFTGLVSTTLLAMAAVSTALPAAQVSSSTGTTEMVEKRDAFRDNKYGRYWPGQMGPHADEPESEPEAIGVDVEKRDAFRDNKYGRYWPGQMGPHADEPEPEAVGVDVEKRDAFRDNKYGRYWPGQMGPAAAEDS